MPNNYNSTLQSNNTDLQAILNTINELPNAGGSDPVLQDKTITPTTSKQTVTADSGYDGLDTVTINAIPNQYITTTDATAVANEIFSGETAYVNGSKITGTFSIDSELTAQDDLIAQIQAAVNSLPEAGSGSEDLDTELTTQESLITELSTILDSKASGGSGGGSVETCTVNITGDVVSPNIKYSEVDTSGNVIVTDYMWPPTVLELAVVRGTLMYIAFTNDVDIITENAELMLHLPASFALININANKNESAKIIMTNSVNGGGGD